MRCNPAKRLYALMFFTGAMLVVGRAEGQPEPDVTAAQPAAVQPPVLDHFVEAPYPPQAERDGRQGAVVLSLTIDEEGRVTDTAVVESAGHGFDQAAVDAAMQFRFRPALRDGAPVAVRIQYRYVFELKRMPAPSPVPPAPPPPEAPVAPALLDEESNVPEYGATASVEAPRREATRRTIEREQLTHTPGTRGDALHAMEVLPGVTEVRDGNLILRGAAYNESQVFFEGAPVPLLYHFGELTSFVNSRLLERVDYYPGNFSVRYGRLVGGVVDVAVRAPRTDGLHGVVDLSLLDTSALVEGPLTSSTGAAVAARRSNIDFVFDRFVPDNTYSVVAAPVYYDAQAMVTHRAGDHELRLLAYASRDQLKLLFSKPNQEDPALRGDIEGLLEFYRIQASAKSRLSPLLEQDLSVMYGRQHFVQRIGALDAELRSDEIHGRGEWRLLASNRLGVTFGVDVETQFGRGRYYGPMPPQNEGDPSSEGRLSTQPNALVEGTFPLISPAAYLEVQARPADALLIVPGVRFDYFGQIHAWSVDPRVSTRFDLSPSTTLKSGVGWFTQRPEYFRAIDRIGNPEIEPYHALHVSVGAEQHFEKTLELDVESFYKSLTNRVVATPGGRPPHFLNDGVGYVIGVEASATIRPAEGTYGYVAYTLSRSERRDGNGPWRLFDADRTHVVSAVASQRLGAGWELGARLRVASGTPETPVEGSVFDATTGQYVPVFGAVNSERAPIEHRLDVRLEKSWRVGPGSIAAYLDVINAYNAQQRVGTRYAYDYRTSEPVTGMPVFPNLGVRGEI